MLITPLKGGQEYKRVNPIPLTAPFGHCVGGGLSKSRDSRPDLNTLVDAERIVRVKNTSLIKDYLYKKII